MRFLAVAAVALGAAACDLDLQDPNIPTEEDVLGNPQTLAQAVVGMQAEFAGQLGDPILTSGMVTNEIGAMAQTYESYWIVDTGTQPTRDDTNFSLGTWSGQYRAIRVINPVLDNAADVGFGPGTVSGIMALGKLLKAMAYGNLLNTYEQIAIDVGPTVTSAQFVSREAAMDEILSLLEEAEAHLQQTPASAEFNAQMLAPGFDLPNTILAMQARYYLIAGDLAAADAAAAAVSPTAFSEFRFSTTDANPVWNWAVNGGNSTAMRPEDIFRLQAEAGDQRVDFWVTEADITGHDVPLDNFDRYSDRSHAIPAYLPDEMTLIRAEVAARQNRLGDALVFVNAVRTDCTALTPTEPVACLPALTLAQVPTQAAMLAEILRQRRYELYMTGLRWLDLRRFDMPLKYNWMPVSGTECDRNANAPQSLCDPEPGNPAGAS